MTDVQAPSLKASAVNALECPLYSLFTSPVEIFHNLAKLSDEATKGERKKLILHFNKLLKH